MTDVGKVKETEKIGFVTVPKMEGNRTACCVPMTAPCSTPVKKEITSVYMVFM